MHVTGKDDRASRRVAPSLLCVPSKVAPLRPFKGCSFAYLERSLLCVPSKVAPLCPFKGRSFASLQSIALAEPRACACVRVRVRVGDARAHRHACVPVWCACVRARARRQMSIGVCFAGSAWYSRLKYLASAPAALPPLEQVNVPRPPAAEPSPVEQAHPPSSSCDSGPEKDMDTRSSCIFSWS